MKRQPNTFQLMLGSNIDAQNNLRLARCLLILQFHDVIFNKPILTPAIGDHARGFYLNQSATLQTYLTKEQLHLQLKQIEYRLHSFKRHHRKGVVRIDIDIL